MEFLHAQRTSTHLRYVPLVEHHQQAHFGLSAHQRHQQVELWHVSHAHVLSGILLNTFGTSHACLCGHSVHSPLHIRQLLCYIKGHQLSSFLQMDYRISNAYILPSQ